MSTGYLFKRSGIWQLRRVRSGKRTTVSTGVRIKSEAEAIRARILAEDSQRRVDRGCLTAGSAWPVFSDSLCRRQCSDSTLAGYKAQWGRFAVGLTETVDLATITRGDVSAYLMGLKASVGPNTWNKHLNCLKYVWKTIQVETGATLPDVFLGIQALPVPLVRHESFSVDQIKALYDAAEGEMKDIIGIAAHTGLRRVDCINLKIGSRSPVDGILRLTPQKTCRTAAQAVIALSPLVTDVWERRKGNGSEYLFPEARLVLNACPQTWGARFQRFMVKTLDLNGDRGLYGFHSLRHWFRSALTDNGVPDAVINVMMCHGQGKVQARYVHPSTSVLQTAVDGLPDFR